MLAIGEIRLARQANILLFNQASAAADNYIRTGESDALAVVRESQSHWIVVLDSHYKTVVKEFIDYTNEQLGITSKKKSFQIIVQEFIRKNALQKSAIISSTTIEQIKRQILNGQQAGLGEAGIAKNIRENVGRDIAQSRARTIARTEVHNAATYAMDATAKESEIVLTKEWVTVEDDRTRDDHAEADGQVVPLEDTFTVGDEELDRPGEGDAANSVNCRCTVIYNTETSESVDSA